MTRTLDVSGTTVLIDEPAAPTTPADTLVMLHGWPDTAALWARTAAALAERYRCVRFTWPGFGPDDADRAHPLDDLVALLHQVVLRVGGGAPVTLVLHDWGCIFGYHFAQRHPALVRRVVGVDVGDANSRAHRAELAGKAKFGILVYQLWLALAWKIGGGFGDRMARKMAKAMRVPTPSADIRARMGYPYWITWTGGHGSYRAAKPYDPPVPMLYLFGKRKPFMFQSRAWCDALNQRPGSRAKGLDSGHWVMVDRAAEFDAAVRDWLRETD